MDVPRPRREIKLILKILPLTTNSLYAHVGRKRFMTAKGKANKEEMGWEARTQYRGRPLEAQICLSAAFYYPKANRDIDNGLKSLQDSLTGILWVDDKQICELHVFKYVDKKNPRVELTVTTGT